MKLKRGEVLQIGVEDISLQREVGKLTLPDDGDQARGLEFFQVVGEGGSGDGLALADIRTGHALFLRADLPENLMAAGIRERLGDEANLLFGEGLRFLHLYPF